MTQSGVGGRGWFRPGTFAVLMLSLMFGASTTRSAPAAAAPVASFVARDGCGVGPAVSTRCEAPGGPESPFEASVRDAQAAAPYAAGSGLAPTGAYSQAQAERTRMLAVTNGTTGSWQSVGLPPLDANGPYDTVSPTGQTIGSLGFRKVSGRLTDYAYDPVGQRLFAGTVFGGVWELDRNATAWHSIGDTLPTQAVGALAWTDAGGGMLVVGTGDNGQGRYSYGGHGVYYSRDLGQTWTQADPSYAVIPDNIESFRVAVDPTNTSLLYLASSRGLFKGTVGPSGALTFVNTRLPTGINGGVDCTGDTTHVPQCYLANTVTDVVVRAADTVSPSPSSSATPSSSPTPAGGSVIATVGYRFGANFYPTPDGTGTTSLKYVVQAGLYRSLQGGTPGTFSYIAPSSSGFPTTDHVGRVALAGAHGPGQNRNVIYAIVQDPLKENHCFDDFGVPPAVCSAGAGTGPGGNLSTALDGMYYSSDFGSSWLKIMDWAQLNLSGTNSSIGSLTGQAPLGYGPGIQASYNLWVLPDPLRTDANGNPSRLLFGLEEIWENNPRYPGPSPTTSDWRTQKVGEFVVPPWHVIGRYWAGCGPLTLGQGFQCNSPTDNPVPGTTTHPDQHAALFIPDGSGGETFWAGSDGGAYSQHVTSASGATPNLSQDSWGDGASAGISSLQCYNAEIARDGTVVCGLQDNGEMKIDPNGKEWQVYGGDGFWSAIDPNNSQHFVEEYVGGVTAFTTDGGVNWSRKDPGLTSARFSTPLQSDPLDAGHMLIGGRDIQEITHAYEPDQCFPSSSQPNSTCVLISTYNQWQSIYDLGTGQHPGDKAATAAAGDTDNSATAVDVRGEKSYVGFCSSCDVMLEGVPFRNGIATNVGGGTPGQVQNAAGWHIAQGLCDNKLGTCPGGVLPHRYITSVRMDPSDGNTIYVTLGGYQRAWIPPGTFGEANPNIGGGHLFKSVDHGDHFTDISANLPNVVAWHSLVHSGHLVVSTDIGVYESTDTNGGTFHVLGANLPAAPVKTIRVAPGNPDLLLAATWGRGPYTYLYPSAATTPTSVPAVLQQLPNTAARAAAGGLPWLPLVPAVGLAGAGAALMRRGRHRA